ncbi:MAG: DNA-directed RNA polymerase [Thermoprotei archaeon]|nr:MAG: DNA-directed RNA polymerase [Thermoprotei archaeon]
MFKIVEFDDVVRVPPSLFSKPLKEAVMEVLRGSYEGQIISDIGLIISILDAEASEYGEVVFNDGALYHRTKFKALVYTPMLHEVVEGEIILVEEFGMLVRLGPIDGFIHKSQIFDDYFSYSRDQDMLLGSKTGRIIRKGDKVRARIVSISYGHRRRALRIGLTMRQPYLGKIEWIEEEIKGIKRETESATS